MSNKKLTLESLQDLVREVLKEGKLQIYPNFESLGDGPHDASSGGKRKKLGININSADFATLARKAEIDPGPGHKNLKSLTKAQITTILKLAPESDITIGNDNTTTAFFSTSDPTSDPTTDTTPDPTSDPTTDTTPPVPDWTLDDELGEFEITTDGFPDPEYKKTGEPKSLRDFVLAALRDSFDDITTQNIIDIAKLKEGIIKEDPDKFEKDDIDAFFDLDPLKPDGSPKDFSGETIEELGRKIEVAIDKYVKHFINNPPEDLDLETLKTKLKNLMTSKKKFLNLVAKSRKLNPGQASGYIPFKGVTAAQINQVKPGLDKGKIDPVIARIYEDFFAGTTTIEQRLRRLSDLSDKFIDPARRSQLTPNDLINGAPILNFMSEMTRTTDPSGAGFIAEGFLAMMVGGEKVGQGYKAGDFIDKDGNEMSAKWLKSTSAVKQPSFINAANKLQRGEELELTYVIGVKTGEDGEILKGDDKVSDPMIVLGMRISVVKYVAKNKSGTIIVQAKDLNGNFYPHSATNNIQLDQKFPIKALTNKAGTSSAHYVTKHIRSQDTFSVSFADTRSSVFEEIYKETVDEGNNQIVKKLTSMYNKFKKITDESNEFVNNKSVGSGFDMADTFIEAKKDLRELVKLVLGDEEASKVTSAAGFTENKQKSKKDLDKLIKEVILKRLLK